MSKCKYDLSEDCHNKDCLACVLDKIRTEILEEVVSHSGTGEEVIQAYVDGLKKVLDIIDKYKAESEPQKSETWVNFADDLIPIIDEAENEGK